jgi:hypothetical protein
MARSIAAALADYLAQCAPFDWRTHNCAQFVAEWLERMEGVRPESPGLSGPLDARRAALALGGTLSDATTVQLGRLPLPAAMARPGDVVLIDRPDLQALGLCAGRTAAYLTASGVAHIPIAAASVAWHLKAIQCAVR